MFKDIPPSTRRLHPDEERIVAALLDLSCDEDRSLLDDMVAQESGGGLLGVVTLYRGGSSEADRRRVIARAEYTDFDGVRAIVSLSSDAQGCIWRLLINRVDGVPIKSLPSPEQLRYPPWQ